MSAAERPARETAEGGWEAAGREGIWGGRNGGEEKFRGGILFLEGENLGKGSGGEERRKDL